MSFRWIRWRGSRFIHAFVVLLEIIEKASDDRRFGQHPGVQFHGHLLTQVKLISGEAADDLEVGGGMGDGGTSPVFGVG